MCGSALQTSPALPQTRRHVTVLFADLVDSTVLGELVDPELLQGVLDRYFSVCTACITEHLGVVEKYIGDAVMAVFGVPAAHEDDAVRAAHAAMAMLGAVDRLNVDLTTTRRVRLELRIGIYAGEVVTGSSQSGNLSVVGDTVNTAARLQAAARPGQVLVGGHAALFARDRLLLEPLAPLTLKGKQGKVPVWQLTSVDIEPGRASGSALTQTALIGRADEIAELEQAYRRSSSLRQSCLMTVLGSPGVGKSRLVREFLDRRGANEVEILVGHCRSYRRGATYQPLKQMLNSIDGGWPVMADFLGASREGSRALHCLTALAGRTEADDLLATGVEEITSAVCDLVKAFARKRPMILVWEDLHWAEPTLLTLIDDLASWLGDVPVMQICVGRPELLSARGSWGGEKPRSATLELGPLSQPDTALLVRALADRCEVVAQQETEQLHHHVVDGCDGNPLFAELLWEVSTVNGSDAAVPPTIQALLGARLDLLMPEERDVLERAAVVGREFALDQLRELGPAGKPTGNVPDADQAAILRLVGQRMLQQTDQGYRFGQGLLRDTVYSLTPKARREDWHLRLAGPAAGPPGDVAAAMMGELPGSPDSEADRDAMVGHHLEAACLLGRQLRPGDQELTERARRAAGMLIALGTRARRRRDLPAAAALLERACTMLPAGDPGHLPLAIQICDCHIARWAVDDALAALTTGERLAPDDGRGSRTAEIQRLQVSAQAGLVPLAEIEVRALAVEVGLRSDPGDDLGWCRFYQLRAFLETFAERVGDAETALRAALGRSRSMANRYEEDRILSGLCELALWGPSDVRASLELCREMADRFVDNRVALVPVLLAKAGLHALNGEIAEARSLIDTVQRYVTDLRLVLDGAAVCQTAGLVESVAGAGATAEAHYRRGASLLRGIGQIQAAQTLEACVARELLAQGKFEGARTALAALAGDSTGDVRTRLIATAAAARLAAADQNPGLAGAAALEAWSLAGSSDDLRLRGDALSDIARGLLAAGDRDLAGKSATAAADCYRAKGAPVLARQILEWAHSAGLDRIRDDARPFP
jgi:class 3 adenylate cyclase